MGLKPGAKRVAKSTGKLDQRRLPLHIWTKCDKEI